MILVHMRTKSGGAEASEVECRRLQAHRAISHALTADKMCLGEAQRQQVGYSQKLLEFAVGFGVRSCEKAMSCAALVSYSGMDEEGREHAACMQAARQQPSLLSCQSSHESH
jgi:hypothetical protein